MQFVMAQFPAIRNFGPLDYSGGTQNWEIAESGSHYIYAANNNGLMVFNGEDWEIAPVLNHTNVHTININRKATRVYVGAFDDLGYFENHEPLRCARYVSLTNLLPQQDRQFKDVWDVESLSDGRVAFQTNEKIFIYNPERETMMTMVPGGRITYMGLADGHLYICSDKGIFRLDDSRLTHLPGSETVSAHHVVGTFLTGAPSERKAGLGKPVFVTRQGRMYMLDGAGAHPYTLPGLADSLNGINIFCTTFNDTWIALGTISHGLIAYERATGRIHFIDRSNGLRNNTVLGLTIDSDNNIWAALDNGISYVIFDSPFREIFTDANNVGTGYASLPVGRRLYVGTNQGLYHVALPDGNVRRFEPVEVKGVSGQIWNLSMIDGVILCGADVGVFTVSGDTATPLSGIGAAWGFKPYPLIPGTVIASAYDGFYVLRRSGASYVVANKIEGSPEGTANFEIGPDGSIWYSHWLHGVYRLTPDAKLTKAVKREIFNASNQLPVDDNNLVTSINGKIHISSTDGFRTPDAGGRLVRAGWLDALFPPSSGVATRIFEDPDGNIWGYREDLLSFARKNGRSYDVRQFHYSATVNRLQMSLGNISFLPGGEGVFNQTDGFFVVDPTASIPAERNVTINYVRTLSSDGDGNFIYLYNAGAPGELSDTFETDKQHNSLYFHYSVSEYRDVKAIKYSTRVKGYEDEWTEYTSTNYREISHLPPGKYEMEVKALDTITGSVSQTSVKFRVLPAWYQTWWALTLFLLAGAGAIYLLIDIMRRRMIRKLEARQAEEQRRMLERAERERLAHEKASALENNEKLSKEIKMKSGQLADSDISAQRKNDVLRDVATQLDEIVRSGNNITSQEMLSKVRRVATSIRIHGKEEVKWERMEQNFNIIFDDLLQKLIKRYPTLTKNDIRLCSYLKLNMSTKEIATLLSVSERSVESNRYRLRKKLGMETGQSFIDFFASFE